MLATTELQGPRASASLCPSDPAYIVQSRLYTHAVPFVCVRQIHPIHMQSRLCVRQIHPTHAVPFLCVRQIHPTHGVPSLCVRQIHLTPYSPVDNLARSWPVYTASVDIGINVRGLNYDLVLSTPFMMGVIRA